MSIPAIPRTTAAIGALRGDLRATRSGAPGWLAAVGAVGLATTLDTAVAHADPGTVELRNGGRIRGEIVAVLPRDRVVVLVADGTSMTIAWTDVDTVVDGDRAYDADGNVSTRPAPSQPAPAPSTEPPPVAHPVPAPQAGTTAADGIGAPPRSFVGPRGEAFADRESFDLYIHLPRRGGAATMATFGGLFFAQGVILSTFGVIVRNFSSYCSGYGGSSYCSRGDRSLSRALLIPGTLSIGLGAFMTGLAIRKFRIRSRAVESLRARGYLVAGLHPSLELGFDVDVSADRVVPRLGLRF